MKNDERFFFFFLLHCMEVVYGGEKGPYIDVDIENRRYIVINRYPWMGGTRAVRVRRASDMSGVPQGLL